MKQQLADHKALQAAKNKDEQFISKLKVRSSALPLH